MQPADMLVDMNSYNMIVFFFIDVYCRLFRAFFPSFTFTRGQCGAVYPCFLETTLQHRSRAGMFAFWNSRIPHHNISHGLQISSDLHSPRKTHVSSNKEKIYIHVISKWESNKVSLIQLQLVFFPFNMPNRLKTMFDKYFYTYIWLDFNV